MPPPPDLLLLVLAGLCLLLASVTDDILVAMASLMLVGLAIVGYCIIVAVGP